MAYEYVVNSDGKTVRVNEPEPTRPTVSAYFDGVPLQYGTPEYEAAKAKQKAEVAERLAARDVDMTSRGYTALNNPSSPSVAKVYAAPNGYTQFSAFPKDSYDRMVEESGKEAWTQYPGVQKAMEEAGNWPAGQPRRFTNGAMYDDGGAGRRPGTQSQTLGGGPMQGTGGQEGVVGNQQSRPAYAGVAARPTGGGVGQANYSVPQQSMRNNAWGDPTVGARQQGGNPLAQALRQFSPQGQALGQYSARNTFGGAPKSGV